MAGGLLTRLARRARGEPEPAELDLIFEHLRSLLNTRRGGSALDPGYGIPDLTDALHAFPLSASAICGELASTIQRFELRLRQVRVTPTPGAETGEALRFDVTATLFCSRGEPPASTARPGTPVRFTTQVTRAGHVSVR